MNGFRLSRRAILRGAGVTLGLPVLDAMLDGRGRWYGRAQAAPSDSPLCLITYCTPNGIHDYRNWYPAETGASYTPREWMKPLEAHKADFTLVTGLPKPEMWLGQDINNDAHVRATATFATGAGITKTGAGGISIDQVIAAQIGGETKFKSLPVAIGKVSDPHVSYISWAGPNQPVPPDRDPEVLFRRLFGGAPGAGPGGDALSKYRKSVLDYVKADLGRLSARVGVADRKRVDAHTGAIRELENQILNDKRATSAACTVPAMPVGATPLLSNERAQLQMRLMVMALACDLSRVASFQLASRADERVFSWLGATKGHHSISHLVDPAGMAMRLKIWMDELEQLAFLFKLLKDTPQADGSLFDRSIVFFSNEHGDGYGDTHYCGDMPIIVAGRAKGRLRTGLHMRLKGGSGMSGTSYSNVFVTIQNLFGLQSGTFGVYGKAGVDGLTT